MKKITAEQKKFKLIHGSIATQLIIFALPILFSNILQQLINTADAFIVGNLISGEALTGVSESGKVTALLISLFLGIGAGAGVVISQYYGARDKEKLSKSVHTTMLLGFILGIAMTGIGLLLSRWVLNIMHVDERHYEFALKYLNIYFLGTVFVLIFNMGSGALRAVGDSVTPLIFLGIAVVVNVFLDIFFIKYLNMGIEGAAWATVISQALAAVLVIIRLTLAKGDYKLSFRKLKLDGEIFLKILKVGIPAGLQNGIISAAHIFMFRYINDFGESAAFGSAVYGKIDGFIYMPFQALSLALSTFVGQNVGANRPDRVKKSIGICLIISQAVTIILCISVFLSNSFLLPIISKDMLVNKEAFNTATLFMQVLVFSYPILVINDTLAGAIRGAGQSLIPAIILVGSMFAIRIVFILSAMPLYNDIRVVFFSYPVSWIFSTICMTLYYFKGKWLKKRKCTIDSGTSGFLIMPNQTIVNHSIKPVVASYAPKDKNQASVNPIAPANDSSNSISLPH